jgi:dolichyl-phosphate beta-glucosyltransferase
VIAPQPNDDKLRTAVEKLVGKPGKWVDGVWVWDLHEGS